MRAVKFRGDLVVEETPIPPVPKDHVLVKVKLASVSPLERGLERGNIWVEPERVLGLEGFGNVLEAGVEGEEEEGKEVLINSYFDGILGVTRDGTLAEYVVVPKESLAEAPDVPDYAKALASASRDFRAVPSTSRLATSPSALLRSMAGATSCCTESAAPKAPAAPAPMPVTCEVTDSFSRESDARSLATFTEALSRSPMANSRRCSLLKAMPCSHHPIIP